MNIQKVLFLKFKREQFTKDDSKEMQKKRIKAMDYLIGKDSDLRVFELYPYENDTIKTKKIIPQYFHEWSYCNTRTKIKNETCAEIDKLDYDSMINLFYDICWELIKKKYHFIVFYAKGQRSPHIRIYDFDELENLTPFQREKAQAQFWRSIIPFRVHLLDQSIWSDEHPLQMEFTEHWKYGTFFDVMFEYNPHPQKNYEEIIKEKKESARKYKEEYYAKTKC